MHFLNLCKYTLHISVQRISFTYYIFWSFERCEMLYNAKFTPGMRLTQYLCRPFYCLEKSCFVKACGRTLPISRKRWTPELDAEIDSYSLSSSSIRSTYLFFVFFRFLHFSPGSSLFVCSKYIHIWLLCIAKSW